METAKLNYRNTFLLGLGFFCISITWPLYNAFVPIFLSKYISSAFIIGIIMTFDNIAAITFQPLFGAISDKTKTRFGRRMPFLLIGIPLSAFFFTMIPFEFNFISLIAFAMCFNLMMSIYRAPTVALMPDLTPSSLRSKANGIINFMGGLGAVIALSIGPKLYDIDRRLPFFCTAILMLFAVIVLYKTIKEPAVPAIDDEEQTGIIHAFKEIFFNKDKSALLMLLAILFWFTGYQGIEALFTLYGVKYLGLKESAAAFTLVFFSATFLLFAIPSGIIATKIGRKRTIKIGLIGIVLIFAGIAFTRDLLIIQILMLVGGIFWALININSYPMVVEMASENKIGSYTGLYYFFSSLAAIAGPPFFGRLMDLIGYGVLFVVAIAFELLAFIFISYVKRGEAAASKEIA